MQADAEAPDVALRCEANGCANGWEVVVHLQREFYLGVRTVFGGYDKLQKNSQLSLFYHYFRLFSENMCQY